MTLAESRIKRIAIACITGLSLILYGSISDAAGRSDNLFESIESAAHANLLPSEILTRLLWVESRFRPMAISPVGAQGVAQFMPATAAERGLVNPFAPEQAIPQAARLLSDLTFRFGNIGLGLAAYNAGPGRIERWLAGSASLPDETRQFVIAITGHSPEEWVGSDLWGRRLTGCRSCGYLENFRIPQPRTEHARMLPILVHSGQPLPSLEGSGRPLSVLQHSGEPLPILRHSGEPLMGRMISGD